MSFDDRKKGFEAKYAHEAQVGFAVEARCSKLFGLWIAEQLGLSQDNAKAYALDVVEANLEEAGFDDVLRKVKKDLEANSVEISDHALNIQLDKCLEEARKQVSSET